MDEIMLSFAANDRSGNPTGKTEVIEFGDWLRLDGKPITCKRVKKGKLRIGQRTFPIKSYGTWAGSCTFDAAVVTRETAQAIAEYLRESGDYAPTEGRIAVWDAWDGGLPILFQE